MDCYWESAASYSNHKVQQVRKNRLSIREMWQESISSGIWQVSKLVALSQAPVCGLASERLNK